MLANTSEHQLDVAPFVQMAKYVERHDHQSEPALQALGTHVAEREPYPLPNRDGLAFQPPPQVVEHEPRSIDAGHLHSGARQRQRHPPVATTVLEDLAAGLTTEANVVGDILGARRVAALVGRDVDVVRQRTRVQRQVRSVHGLC